MKTAARSRALGSLSLFTFAAFALSATTALAQVPKKPGKKKPKPPAAEPAPEPAPAPEPPPPAPEPTPAPVEPAPVATDAPAPKEEPAAVEDDGIEEKPGLKYNFVGLRYRGTVIPKFMLNLFADEGKTIYSNQIGLEYEIRRDGFSMIPWLSYAEYGTGDMLFHEKGQPDAPQWYSIVNSGLKGVYAGIDLLWSTQVSKNVAIEYGGGAGLGFIFGDLSNNWAQQDPTNSSPNIGSNGNHYIACTSTNPPGSGCDPAFHKTSNTVKVGGYTEKNWFSGGSVPVFFPTFSIPQIGVRVKPHKSIVARVNVGFSITGFFFGISGSYGLPQKSEGEAASPAPSTK